MSRHLSENVAYRHRRDGFAVVGYSIARAIKSEDHMQQKAKDTPMKNVSSLSAIVSKIDHALAIDSKPSAPTPEELPVISPVIPVGPSRESYPPELVAMLPVIPESRLDALSNNTQRLQADARANQVIPRIFSRWSDVLTVEDSVALSGEQTKLRSLLSAFGWFLDGFTDASRTELR